MSRRRHRGTSPTAALSKVSTNEILESISDGVFTVDSNWRISSFNRAAEQITGIGRSDAIGRRCSDVFRASMCETECALRHTLETGTPVVNRTGFIVDAKGRRIPISVSTALLRDERGNIVGGAETFRDLSLIEELRKEIQGRFQVGNIFSRSSAMRRILEVLPRIAESESTILLQGETGTGKELVARAIHSLSSRREGPFVALNCGALPDTLLESELFGYKAGAFTGATKDKPGRFALARRGTLFLDEISEISPALQVRLLRVLQERQFDPVGSTHSEKTDVRVVTATNRDLATLVENGIFRQDLFYRIHVMKLELPPLRRRREDIPLLLQHFISSFNAIQDKQVTDIHPDVMAILMAYEYPGNVRELQNIVEHAFMLCGNGPISLEHLPSEIIPFARYSKPKQRMQDIVSAVEAQTIREALERNQGNRLATAHELNMHKSTFFRKVKLYAIELPKNDGRNRSPSSAKR